MQKILRFLAMGSTFCAAGALLAAPAGADVKAGVDAWADGKYEAAVQQWRPLADKGDADAEFNLAQAYKMGRGVPVDLEQAETLYGKAAAQGHVQAADNYGLLLFQSGARQKAMPYIADAAARGDARAQYILGIAHFNGDLAAKDWVRAYALLSLAQQAGLPQATRALTQMDEHIPLEQRQQSVPLAAQLSAEAEAARARIDASSSLGGPTPAPIRPQSGLSIAGQAAPVPDGPATAGADYARPPIPGATRSTMTGSTPAGNAHATNLATTRPATAQGGWRLRLGAFSVAANAEALWARLSKHAELAGSRRELVRSGRFTFLYATGLSSKAVADRACSTIRSNGHQCIVTPPK